jgi:hypothetical protein
MKEPQVSSVDFAQRLTEARHQVDLIRLRGGPSRGPNQGVGSAGDGRVRATVAHDGVLDIELDAKVVAGDPTELGALVCTAVNGAFASVFAAGRESARAPDLVALATLIEAAQAEGVRTIGTISSSIQDAADRVNGRTPMNGDTGTQGLEHILARTLTAIQAAQDLRATDSRSAAEGSDEERLVCVEVDRCRRLTEVRIAAAARRLNPTELSRRLVTATNNALAARPVTAEELRRRAEQAAHLSATVRRLQDESLDQMQVYGQALRAMMTSVQGP